MTTDDLSLVTDDYTVTGSGSVGLDGSLDLATNVAMTPAGVTKLLLWRRCPSSSTFRTCRHPHRITGTSAATIIRPDIRWPFRVARRAGALVDGQRRRACGDVGEERPAAASPSADTGRETSEVNGSGFGRVWAAPGP